MSKNETALKAKIVMHMLDIKKVQQSRYRPEVAQRVPGS